MAELRIATIKDNEEDAYKGMCACGYVTSGWPKQGIAEERITQHKNEHKTGELMELISAFRERHGLVPAGNQAVFPEGAREIKGES